MLHSIAQGLLCRHRQQEKVPVIAAGGIRNHVHLGIALPPTTKLSGALSAFKADSSRWLKEKGVTDFSWQTGYGAFSFGRSQVSPVKRYVFNQAEHHKRYTFEEEFLEMLRRADVDYDSQQVFE
jgi:REP-associated tyrosine transposase